jgi:hypothetical protein
MNKFAIAAILSLLGVLIIFGIFYTLMSEETPFPTPSIAKSEDAVGTVYRHLHDCATTSRGEQVFDELWSSSYNMAAYPDYDYGWNVSTTFYCWSDEGNPLFDPLPEDDPLFDNESYSYVYVMNWQVSADLEQVSPADENAAGLESELGCGE